MPYTPPDARPWKRKNWADVKRVAALKAAHEGATWMGIAQAAGMPYERLRELRTEDTLFNHLLLAARDAGQRGEDFRL